MVKVCIEMGVLGKEQDNVLSLEHGNLWSFKMSIFRNYLHKQVINTEVSSGLKIDTKV
jgi:hypothetical protein